MHAALATPARTRHSMPITSTSESSPLRIAAVTPGDGQGRIGITLCPGKTDPAAISGPTARDLDIDLDAIRRWGATVVLSLITDEEIDQLSVRGLPEAVRDRHMEWWHAPIPDGMPPGADFEEAWTVAGEAIRDRLRLGFDVLVHCKGAWAAPGPSPPGCWWSWGLARTTRSGRVRGRSAGSHRERVSGGPRGAVRAAAARGSASDRGHHRGPGARGVPRSGGGRRGGHDARVPPPRRAATTGRHGRGRPVLPAARRVDRRHRHGAGSCRQHRGVGDARPPGPDGSLRPMVAARRLLAHRANVQISETPPSMRSTATCRPASRSPARPIRAARATAR